MSQTSQTAVIGISTSLATMSVVPLCCARSGRGQVEARFANLPPCLIGMEACVGAHHLSRRLQALGHDARLMPAKYVRPYSKDRRTTSAMRRRSPRRCSGRR
jgi:transposase